VPRGGAPVSVLPGAVGTVHRRRLRDVWRSAGWPYQDLVEVELLAAGLLERVRDPTGRETVRVTDAGVALLAQTLQHHRAARDAHEALVSLVVRQMQRAGRLVWRGLALRAPLGGAPAQTAEVTGTPAASVRWTMAVPDVFSIRHTTREDLVEPVVHEIKVRRADLLADLRREDKRAAYLALAGECWYVLGEGVGGAGDVPLPCGVLLARDGALEVLRPAVRRARRVPFILWMALARAAPQEPDSTSQQALGEMPEPD
jgi:DNA-binding MarR family transcriptional regulator